MGLFSFSEEGYFFKEGLNVKMLNILLNFTKILNYYHFACQLLRAFREELRNNCQVYSKCIC